jgi:ribosomal protein S18
MPDYCNNPNCMEVNAPLDCVGCGRSVAKGGQGVVDFDQKFHKFVRSDALTASKTSAQVHDLKPLVDKLRNAEHEDSKDLTKKLIDLSKALDAGDLRDAAKHYLTTLGKIEERKETGTVPRRSQRAADDAWKRLESAFVHFVR